MSVGVGEAVKGGVGPSKSRRISAEEDREMGTGSEDEASLES